MKVVKLILLHIQLGSIYWWLSGFDFSVIAAAGQQNAFDRVEYLEYNLESNLSHLSFRFQRSFFACHRCTDQNYRLCCERHQICCHFVYQCPISDSVQCIKPCDNGCAIGQICCPRRRKFPCCSVPAQNYIIPPIRKLRANNSYQMSNSTNAVEDTKVNVTFNKPLSQTSEHSDDNNNGNSTDVLLSSSLLPNEAEDQTEDSIATIEQINNSNNFSQAFNDDQGTSTDETMTTDNKETTTDRLMQSTTIATVETLSDPEMENSSYFEESTTPPTIFPDFTYDVSLSNSSGNDSESYDSAFNSSVAESTPSTWWNNEEPTSIWNVKNVDEELNKTWSSQPTEDDSGSEVSYFPADD